MQTKKSTLFHLDCIMHSILSIRGKCEDHSILWTIKDNISFSNDPKAFEFYTYDIQKIINSLSQKEIEKYKLNLKTMKNYF